MNRIPAFAHHKQETVQSFREFLSGGPFPAYPLEIFLEISNICNMKCAMCSVFSELNPKRLFALKSSDRGFLPDRHLEKLDNLLSHALLVHCFGYGEPTIHPRFAEILDFALKKEVMVDFFTNGMNLTEELCRFLVDRNIFRVTVSFSGASQDDYENMYLDGKYDKVLAGIERLARLKAERGNPYPTIEINSIAFQHHIDRLPSFVEQMAALGVNAINLKPLHLSAAIPELHRYAAVMRPWHEGKLLAEAKQKAEQLGVRFVDEFSNVASVGPTQDEEEVRGRLLAGTDELSKTEIPLTEFKTRAKSIEPLVPSKSDGATAERETAMDHTPETVRSFLRIKPLAGAPEEMCYEPFKTFYVNQQGGVRPCCFGFTHTHLGNLDRHPAKRIWSGLGFNTVRRAIRNGRYPMSICRSCLKHKSYPKQNNFLGLVDAYAAWYRHSFDATFPQEPSEFAQLFVDTGASFNERESLIQPIVPGLPQRIEFDTSLFPEIRALRFDPINVPGQVTIVNATAVGPENEESILALEPLNAARIDGSEARFDTADPQFSVAGFPRRGCRKIRITIRAQALDNANESEDRGVAVQPPALRY